MRLSGKTIIDRLVSPVGIDIPTEFSLSEFEKSVYNQGNTVVYEKCYICPCKSEESDHLNICKNCSGVGWFFANPTKTKMIISGLVYNKKFEEMGAQDIGTVSVTAIDADKLSFMDKIVLIDSTGEFTQVVYPKLTDDETTLFAYAKYDILSVDFIGLFNGADNKIQRLIEPDDYSWRDNVLTLDPKYNDLEKPCVTIRYKYNPVFHIIDIPRESMSSYKNKALIKQIMPIHAIAQRAHLIKELENFGGDRLVDNSWLPLPTEEAETTQFNRILKYTSAQDIYDNLTSIQIQQLNELINGS